MKIRELQPGAAWNDAERRSIPIGIVGFFLSGLLSTFGVLDAIPSAFAAGVCGAVAFYFATVALLIGYYHKRMLLGASVSSLTFVTPWLVRILAFRMPSRGLAMFVLLAAGATIYFVLHRFHFALSNVSAHEYMNQLAYEQQGEPKASWQTLVFVVCLVVGAAVLLLLLRMR
jgi:cytosine/uracil/thiamine/allantoin permease